MRTGEKNQREIEKAPPPLSLLLFPHHNIFFFSFFFFLNIDIAKLVERDDSRKQIVLIGHSKGGVDLTAAVSILKDEREGKGREGKEEQEKGKGGEELKRRKGREELRREEKRRKRNGTRRRMKRMRDKKREEERHPTIESIFFFSFRSSCFFLTSFLALYVSAHSTSHPCSHLHPSSARRYLLFISWKQTKEKEPIFFFPFSLFQELRFPRIF